MTSRDRLEVAERRISGSDDETRSQPALEQTRRRLRHRRRRLAGRDAHVARTIERGGKTHPHRRSRELQQGGARQLARIARTNPSPNDVEEVVSELVARAFQWVCLGSDQADKPVTTSNFFRSELTNWGALS